MRFFICALLLPLMVVGCKFKTAPRVYKTPVATVLMGTSLPVNWNYRGLGGGGGNDGGDYAWEIDLEGNSPNDVMREIRERLRNIAAAGGYSLGGGGEGRSEKGLYSFSFYASDDDSRAHVVVRSVEVAEKKILVTMAVAQIGGGASPLSPKSVSP
jgi:hypothetical protein